MGGGKEAATLTAQFGFRCPGGATRRRAAARPRASARPTSVAAPAPSGDRQRAVHQHPHAPHAAWPTRSPRTVSTWEGACPGRPGRVGRRSSVGRLCLAPPGRGTPRARKAPSDRGCKPTAQQPGLLSRIFGLFPHTTATPILRSTLSLTLPPPASLHGTPHPALMQSPTSIEVLGQGYLAMDCLTRCARWPGHPPAPRTHPDLPARSLAESCHMDCGRGDCVIYVAHKYVHPTPDVRGPSLRPDGLRTLVRWTVDWAPEFDGSHCASSCGARDGTRLMAL